MKKIKLLFIISNLNIGGPQKSLLALLDNIDYDLFDVDVVSIKNDGALKNFFNNNITFLDPHELITATTLPSDSIFKSLITFLKYRKISLLISSLISIMKHVLFKKNMNQERQKIWNNYHTELPVFSKEYDMAFGILGLSTYFIADLVKSEKKYHWIRSDTRILKRNEEIDSKYFKQMDEFLAVSNETARIFENMYSFSKGRVHPFYNYIPTAFYNNIPYDKNLMETDNNEIKLLTITRLDPLKGLEFAIEACKILVNKGYNIIWYVLGDGKYKKDVENMISEHDLENYFILLGFQMNTLNFIEDADIVVHPSRTEGKSNAVDEAKFIGKPIVATNYDTVGEQIEDGKTGLISDMNGKDLSKKIESLLDNKTLQKKLVINCINHPENSLDASEFFIDLFGIGSEII